LIKIASGKLRYTATSTEELPVVGDWVITEGDGDGVIHRVLPRKSKFSRVAAGEKTIEQIAAANIDTVFIVMGLDHDYNLRRIERYAAVAWDSGANPVIILNKVDLSDDPEKYIRLAEEVAPGIPIHAISALAQDSTSNRKILINYLKPGKTAVLLGSSGTGKSTITNLLLGSEHQKTAAVREDDSRGRHITTARQMFLIPSGGIIIDTPGMRELKLWSSDDSLEEVFSEIEEVARYCRFADCSHQGEPGCAVAEAVEAGKISKEGVTSYLKLQRELAYIERRQKEGAARVEKLRWKKIAKEIKTLNKRK
jgi:ribosome biogenesis GTPase